MIHGGMGVATNAYPMTKSVLSSSMRYGGMLVHYSGSSSTSADEHKIGQLMSKLGLYFKLVEDILLLKLIAQAITIRVLLVLNNNDNFLCYFILQSSIIQKNKLYLNFLLKLLL
ncbi:chromatin structure-remodeling complex protein SYD isoform [Arachis hypogaea]|nr:chromatin structure-remodeling complex protein SYD isoform [Arachis hypogaea]